MPAGGAAFVVLTAAKPNMAQVSDIHEAMQCRKAISAWVGAARRVRVNRLVPLAALATAQTIPKVCKPDGSSNFKLEHNQCKCFYSSEIHTNDAESDRHRFSPGRDSGNKSSNGIIKRLSLNV